MMNISMIPTSMLSLLLLFLSFHLTFSAAALTRDGVLLLSFKYSITSDPQSALSSWTYSDETPCYWRGVTCGSPGSPDYDRVVGVSLPSSQLSGSISPELGFLEHLQLLNLSSNSLNGSISPYLFPPSSQLRILDLSGNLLSGDIPEVVGGLQNLQVLNLSGNSFTGELPKNLTELTNLTEVSLSDNYFTGRLWSGLNQVRFLDLSSNLVNGSLPPGFGGESIHYLNVSFNRISGEIPPDFAAGIPEDATLDFSHNNLTGEIPAANVLLNQTAESFSDNAADLCGKPLSNPCTIPSDPTSSLPSGSSSQAPSTSPPAIAAIPRTFNSQPAEDPSQQDEEAPSSSSGPRLRPRTIALIVAGDLAGIAMITLVFFYVYRWKRNINNDSPGGKSRELNSSTDAPPSASSTASESKGISNWACLLRKKNRGGDEEESTSSDEESSEVEDSENTALNGHSKRGGRAAEQQEKGKLVTVDGGAELELETLLKASAYILGASGPTILYKAVLEDGSAVAVRRIGEGGRAAEFEGNVRAVAKVAANHPNLVRIRGFYLGSDEKLIIYEYVPNGSLVNARYRGGGSSPCHLPWEYRLRIAKGVARGLCYLHDKKHVHANLKPSNILLDADMDPKISDFGLDRIAPSSAAVGDSGYRPGFSFSTRHFGSKRSTASRDSFHQQDANFGVGPGPSPSPSPNPSPSPSPIPSSIGCFSPYHPPESLRSLKPNSKWDVYSFGVLLIELLTGKVLGPDDLGPWMAGLPADSEDKTRVLRMADGPIRSELEDKEEALLACLKLGCSCVAVQPQKRPSIKEALQVLERVPVISTSLRYY